MSTVRMGTSLVSLALVISLTSHADPIDSPASAERPIVAPAAVAFANPELLAAFLVVYEDMRAKAKDRAVSPMTIRDDYWGIGLQMSGDTASITFLGPPPPSLGGDTTYTVDLKTLKIISVDAQR